MEDDLLATTLGQIMVGRHEELIILNFFCACLSICHVIRHVTFFLFKSQIISKLMAGLKQEIMTSNSI